MQRAVSLCLGHFSVHQHRWSLLVAASAFFCVVSTQVKAQNTEAVAADSATSADQTKRRLIVAPRIGVTETVTDNLQLQARGLQDAASITLLEPGVSVIVNGNHLKGRLDAALRSFSYAKTERSNEMQKQLAAEGQLSGWEERASMAIRATVSQQSISAFGAPTQNNGLINSNQTEVANLSLLPQLKTHMGRFLDFEVEGQLAETRAKNQLTGDFSTRGLTARIKNQGSANHSGWSVEVGRQDSNPAVGRDTSLSHLLATGSYIPDVDVQAQLRAGVERSNYVSVDQVDSSTYGASLKWTPSARTTAQLSWDHHSFGDGHQLSLEHRTARTAWKYSDSSSVTMGGSTPGAATTTNYDLLYYQFASIEPDPVARKKLVDDSLAKLGLNPGASSSTGFLTSMLNAARRQEMSIAFLGVRASATVVIFKSTVARVGPIASLQDELAKVGNVSQRGATLTMGYRVNPTDALNFSFLYMNSLADVSAVSARTKSFLSAWSGQLGRALKFSLGVRRAEFVSPNTSYVENAVIGSLYQQF